MIPRRVRTATWIAFGLNGLLILSARYRLSYDAYNHMFFGDHYRLDWWSLWEPRWYTGFEVTSYPPLVHQLIGLLGHLIGVDAAFALLLWIVLAAYPVGIYVFTRAFAGGVAAGYAGLGAAVLPALYLSAHTFGQLPTLAGTLCALFAVAALNDFILRGNKLSGALSVALIGVIMAAHHATLLFLPFAIGALIIHVWLNKNNNKVILLARIACFAICAALISLIVIWPFWQWGLHQTMQPPIDHLSRHNFLRDPLALVTFFLPVYGTLIPFIPLVLWKGLSRATFGLWLAFSGLFSLGLGGTTPLPHLLFGAGWEWLTYDRFAFWASLVFMPFFGMAMIIYRKKYLKQNKSSLIIRRRRFVKGVFISLGIVSFISGLLPTLLPTQPAPVNMRPIVDFLADGDRSRWRYLTFGFGDQFAYLSRLTKATTIDGSYHTARALSELRASGLGQIDTAYWIPSGFKLLDPVLQKAGERGVRWGFVNRAEYVPVLIRNGWVYRLTLSNKIQVWENPQAVIPSPVQAPDENPMAVFSWGVLPLFTLYVAGALGALRLAPARAQNILEGIHALAVGLLPLAMCFWYYRTLIVIEHAKVYFTYNQTLFYLSDGLAVIAFSAWGLPQVASLLRGTGRKYVLQTPIEVLRQSPVLGSWFIARSDVWFFALCCLASLSILWSQDWRVSFFFSLHLWLVYGLFLSLRDRAESWRAFAFGCVAALMLQTFIGVWEFVAQSTSFLAVMKMEWPGALQPATVAASIVQLADGMRWLRVYGSLPHPNILGGLVFIFIACLSALYLLGAGGRPHYFLLISIALGVMLLIFTFSRSAWIGLVVFILLLLKRYRSFNRKLALILAGVMLFSAIVTAYPLRALILARAPGATAHDEAFSSIARTWLTQEGLQFTSEHPLTGLGAGAFILELAQRASYGYIVEPVHNILLLVTSELGIGAGMILIALVTILIWRVFKAHRPETILFASATLGLLFIGLFDHYLWTLAPGRLLTGLMLGLAAGQMRRDEQCS